MRKVRGLGGLAKRTLLEVGLGIAGVFLFRALERLEVGVGEGGEEFLIGVAGVLVTSGPEPPGIWLNAKVSTIDDVGIILPDAVILGAGVCLGLDVGVW